MNPTELWTRYQQQLCDCPTVGMRLDFSRMGIDDAFLSRMQEPIQKSLAAMKELEAGAIANPDEKRMVGHYWLRAEIGRAHV